MKLKSTSVLLLFVFALASTLNNLYAGSSKSKEIITDFFMAANNADFETISTLISDDFVISEGNFIIANSKEKFREVFLWDSEFSPKTTVIDITEKDNAFEVILTKICKRIKFLHDSEIKIKVRVTIKNGMITRMETNDYLKFDLDKFQKRRGEFVRWVSANHPELSGFINDQTKEGAKKYLKAIDLYKKK